MSVNWPPLDSQDIRKQTSAMSGLRSDTMSISIRLGVGPQVSFTRLHTTWEECLSTNLIHCLPVITTFVAVAFFRELWKHWQRNPSARYVMWWMIGVGLFGLGTLTEALTTIFGWHEPVFRTWYIAGALLGGAPLARLPPAFKTDRGSSRSGTRRLCRNRFSVRGYDAGPLRDRAHRAPAHLGRASRHRRGSSDLDTSNTAKDKSPFLNQNHVRQNQ